eukprot:133709_1
MTTAVSRKELLRLSKIELIKKCKQAKLPTNGSKGDIANRLIQHSTKIITKEYKKTTKKIKTKTKTKKKQKKRSKLSTETKKEEPVIEPEKARTNITNLTRSKLDKLVSGFTRIRHELSAVKQVFIDFSLCMTQKYFQVLIADVAHKHLGKRYFKLSEIDRYEKRKKNTFNSPFPTLNTKSKTKSINLINMSVHQRDVIGDSDSDSDMTQTGQIEYVSKNNPNYKIDENKCPKCLRSKADDNILKFHCCYQGVESNESGKERFNNNVIEYQCMDCKHFIAFNFREKLEKMFVSFTFDRGSCSISLFGIKTNKTISCRGGLHRCPECNQLMTLLDYYRNDQGETYGRIDTTDIYFCNSCELFVTYDETEYVMREDF